MLTLNYQLLNHVMGGYTQITVILSNLERYISFTISDVTFIELYQFMLSFLNNLSRNLSKYQFRETRKYLESFYINNQINYKPITWQNVEKKTKPCTSMKTIQTTLTNHQHSRQINNIKSKKTWRWWQEKEMTHINVWTSLNDSRTTVTA